MATRRVLAAAVGLGLLAAVGWFLARTRPVPAHPPVESTERGARPERRLHRLPVASRAEQEPSPPSVPPAPRFDTNPLAQLRALARARGAPVRCALPVEATAGPGVADARLLDESGQPIAGVEGVVVAASFVGIETDLPEGAGVLSFPGVLDVELSWSGEACRFGRILAEHRVPVGGTVRDPAGRPVPGAHVLACTGTSAPTDADGAWFTWVPRVGPCAFRALLLLPEHRFALGPAVEADTRTGDELQVDLTLSVAEDAREVPEAFRSLWELVDAQQRLVREHPALARGPMEQGLGTSLARLVPVLSQSDAVSSALADQGVDLQDLVDEAAASGAPAGADALLELDGGLQPAASP